MLKKPEKLNVIVIVIEQVRTDAQMRSEAQRNVAKRSEALRSVESTMQELDIFIKKTCVGYGLVW